MPSLPADRSLPAAPLPARPSLPTNTVVIACGALVREIRSVSDQLGWTDANMAYLPAPLHNRPEKIVPAVLEAIADLGDVTGIRILIGYADCGTGGHLDRAIADLRDDGLDVVRLPGAHCYEFLTGTDAFTDLHGLDSTEADLGTFFLTDFLARAFEPLIWRTFRFDEHPELISMVFANYTRVVHLAQTDDPAVTALAVAAAGRLGLPFERRYTGLDPFTTTVVDLLTGAH